MLTWAIATPGVLRLEENPSFEVRAYNASGARGFAVYIEGSALRSADLSVHVFERLAEAKAYTEDLYNKDVLYRLDLMEMGVVAG